MNLIIKNGDETVETIRCSDLDNVTTIKKKLVTLLTSKGYPIPSHIDFEIQVLKKSQVEDNYTFMPQVQSPNRTQVPKTDSKNVKTEKISSPSGTLRGLQEEAYSVIINGFNNKSPSPKGNVAHSDNYSAIMNSSVSLTSPIGTARELPETYSVINSGSNNKSSPPRGNPVHETYSVMSSISNAQSPKGNNDPNNKSPSPRGNPVHETYSVMSSISNAQFPKGNCRTSFTILPSDEDQLSFSAPTLPRNYELKRNLQSSNPEYSTITSDMISPTPFHTVYGNVKVPSHLMNSQVSPVASDSVLDIRTLIQSPNTIQSSKTYPFFHNVDSNAAFNILKRAINGTFLIRPASNDICGFTIEVVQNQQIQKISLKADDRAIWLARDDIKYPNLGELISTMSDFLKNPQISQDYIRTRNEKIYTFSSHDVLKSGDIIVSEPSSGEAYKSVSEGSSSEELCITTTISRSIDDIEKCLLNYSSLKNTHQVLLILKVSAVTPNIVDRSTGNTPLHFATKGHDLLAVQALLKRGANPSLSNWEGQTALDYARNSSNEELKKMLFQGNFSEGHFVNIISKTDQFDTTDPLKVLHVSGDDVFLFSSRTLSTGFSKNSNLRILPYQQELECSQQRREALNSFLKRNCKF